VNNRRELIVVLVGLAVLVTGCGPTIVPPTAMPTGTPTAAPTSSPTPGPANDGVIDRASLRHDSRDTLYRAPGGAVPAGTPVMLRFRTLHDDVTSVVARVYSVNAGDDQQLPMERVATGVSCYDDELSAQTCDFWQTTLGNDAPDNLWYRFIVQDGDAKLFYADNTPALDGGMGAPSDVVIDQSWALTVYEPDFVAPSWTTTGVVYQIFPDRFRNGDAANDPQTGDVRYDDPVIAMPWDALPEGYCRRYSDDACDQEPHGRDYFGGDLAGITEKLDYLADLGVTVLYLNPIFDSASNHGYDTQDWTRIDPYFGTGADWAELVRQADAHGIRIILDGVFNHVSSDSPFFDRYGHYADSGGCEAEDSPYREWFYFRPQLDGVCAGPDGPGTVGYAGWSGYDSIPVIQKGLAEVQELLLLGDDSIVRRWLEAGASGWRLDVSSDPTFPDDWWPTFREVVKDRDPAALTVAEQWQKDTTLLRQLRGDRFDTTMNYRFRDAVLGFLAPGLFDRKGFPASGAPTDPIDFANRMLSQQEDYPPEVYRSLLNLIDSHDTERALWTLTFGDETTAGRELDAAALADGKRRLALAALIQFTMPGMPTVYYGDEVGLTGDDDPDDRRPYPWSDLGGTPDDELLDRYQTLAGVRQADPVLTQGDLRFLLVGTDDEGTVAYGRRMDSAAAVVALNRSNEARNVTVPVAGFLPDGTQLTWRFATGAVPQEVTVRDGAITFDLPPLSGVLLEAADINLEPPAPSNLVFAGDRFDHDDSAGAVSYNLYASPVSGGGYVRVASLADAPAGSRYFVVTAVDEAGNESGYSNEVEVTPPA
jgi:glycosidase